MFIAATLRPEARNPKCRFARFWTPAPKPGWWVLCGMTTGAAAAAADKGEGERAGRWKGVGRGSGDLQGTPLPPSPFASFEASLGHQPGGRMSSSKTLCVEN